MIGTVIVPDIPGVTTQVRDDVAGATWRAGGTKYALLTINPFLNYNFGGGWFVGTVPIITANLDAGGAKWTVPVERNSDA